jgi:hypothetical protein
LPKFEQGHRVSGIVAASRFFVGNKRSGEI